MIDKNYKKSSLEVAKEIASKYLNNPVLDSDGTGKNTTPITEIYVINKEHAVFVNADLDKITEYADSKKHLVTVVMTDGKIIEENESVEEDIEIEEEIIKVKKKNLKNI